MRNILSLILISLTLSSVFSKLKVNTDTNLLIDSKGNTRILHGVNVVYKPAPYYPQYNTTFTPMDSFCQEDVDNLVEWGFNVVRLYIAWEGVEPVESQYNSTYIQEVKNIVEMCAESNIYVFLDMHQDLYSNYFCGEGLPKWAVEYSMDAKTRASFPEPLNIELGRDENGYPLIEDCHKSAFFKYYFTKDVNQISQDLLTNMEGLADKMARFWGYVATEFRDYEKILGYELINEPWGIDIYKNPIKDLLPGAQNNDVLLPFYSKMNEKIRRVDTQSIILYEPITWDFINSGFETNLGGKQYRDREMLSYHIYCPLVNADGQPTNALACKLFDAFESNGKEANYKQMGIGGFLTEFGALDNTEKSAEEVDRLCGNADKIFNSWAYWQYKYFNDITTAAASPDAEGFWNSKGELQTVKVGALARSYAYQMCGVPQKMTWNRKKQTFQLEVQINRKQCQNGQTQIYLSEFFFYQNGYNAVFSNCPNCKLVQLEGVQAKGYYYVDGDSYLDDQVIWSLKVTPKN